MKLRLAVLAFVVLALPMLSIASDPDNNAYPACYPCDAASK